VTEIEGKAKYDIYSVAEPIRGTIATGDTEQESEPRTGGSQNLDVQSTAFNPISEKRREASPRGSASTNPLNEMEEILRTECLP
jgi:hypothetical protein